MIKYIKNLVKQNIFKPYWNSKGSFIYCDQRVYFPKNNAIFNRTMHEGIFELENFEAMDRLVKPNTEVFDVGANIGIMLIPILKSHQDITLVAIEASPNNIPYLKKTHAASPYKNRWTIIDQAAFNFVGKINFQLASAENGAFDSIHDNKRIAFERTVEIACTTIDTVWESRNKPQVSFIKIDIEGADLVALNSAENCINTCKPSILMEWNQANIKPFNLVNKDLFEFCNSINYTLYALPNLIKVTDLRDLELYSKFTENFLLIPNDAE
ncbi:MAG: FkbM family methyltransferase [Mucilaginibacter sp.]